MPPPGKNGGTFVHAYKTTHVTLVVCRYVQMCRRLHFVYNSRLGQEGHFDVEIEKNRFVTLLAMYTSFFYFVRV